MPVQDRRSVSGKRTTNVLGLAESFGLFVTEERGGRVRQSPLPETLYNEEMNVELERSISSGSTLTLAMRDPERVLQKMGYFTRDVGTHRGHKSDMLFDDLWFRACHFEKKQDEYTMQFEDREIAIARDYSKTFKMSAGGHPNPTAAFLKFLFKKAVPHVVFFCPEFDKQIKILPYKETQKQKERKKKPGIPKTIQTKGGKVIATAASSSGSSGGGGSGSSGSSGGGNLTVKKAPMDGEQKKMAEILLGVCDAMNAPGMAKIAIICAAIGESDMHNDTTANSDGYWGVLQGGSGQGKSEPNFPHTPNDQVAKEMAECFLRGGKGFQAGGAIALVHGGNSDPGDIATKVEASGEPASFYGEHRGEAEAIVGGVSPGSPGGPGGEGTGTSGEAEGKHTPQRFLTMPINEQQEGEEPEGAWEAAEQYAEKIRWRLFCTGGQFNFVSDTYLEHAKPRMTIDIEDDKLIDVQWAIDAREKKNPPQLTVEAYCKDWEAGPGGSVVVGERLGKELHEGVWLVSTITRKDITSDQCVIVLERPRDPLAEHSLKPVGEKTSQSILTKGPGAGSSAIPTPNGTETSEGWNAGVAGPAGHGAEEVYLNAKWIDEQKYPYVYGGGHGSALGPTNPAGGTGSKATGVGLDCSSAVSWALGGGEAGQLPGGHPYTTVGLQYWGVPGEGTYYTVWVCQEPGVEEHVYIEFKFPHRHINWEAAHTGTIVGFKPYFSPPNGFHPRHWPEHGIEGRHG